MHLPMVDDYRKHREATFKRVHLMGPSFYQLNVIDRVPEVLDRLDAQGPREAAWPQTSAGAGSVEAEATVRREPTPALDEMEMRQSGSIDQPASQGHAAAAVDEPAPAPEIERAGVLSEVPQPSEAEAGRRLTNAVGSDVVEPIVVAPELLPDMSQTLRRQVESVFLGSLEAPRPSPLVTVTINTPPPTANEAPRSPSGPGPIARAVTAGRAVVAAGTRLRADIRYALALAAALAAVALVLSKALVSVPQGTVGVRTGLGFPSGTLLTPGPYVVIPGLGGVTLYATGELGRDVRMSGLITADGFAVPSTSVKVAYRVEPDAIGQVVGLESAPAIGPGGVVQPMSEKVARDVERIFGTMVGMVESDRLAGMRVKMGVLLHEELQASLDAWVAGAVRVVGVDVGALHLGASAAHVASDRSDDSTTESATSDPAKRGLMSADDGY